MKIFPILASSLSLSAMLLSAQAQQLPKSTAKSLNTKDKDATARATADHRAAAYKGPRVMNSTKDLGKKMLRDSKAAPTLVAPAKQ